MLSGGFNEFIINVQKIDYVAMIVTAQLVLPCAAFYPVGCV
jgi:hypothetical protein